MSKKRTVISATLAAGVAVSTADAHPVASLAGNQAESADMIETVFDVDGDDYVLSFGDERPDDALDLLPEVLDATHTEQDRDIHIEYAQTYFGGGGGGGDSIRRGTGTGNSGSITFDNGLKKGGKIKMDGPQHKR